MVGFIHTAEYPGIITQGDTESELDYMIQDATSCYFGSFPEELKKLHAQKNKTIQETKDVKIITVDV